MKFIQKVMLSIAILLSLFCLLGAVFSGFGTRKTWVADARAGKPLRRSLNIRDCQPLYKRRSKQHAAALEYFPMSLIIEHGTIRSGTLLLVLMLAGSMASADPAMKVVFMSPDPAPVPGKSDFWHEAVDFMQAVADDLNIELKIVYSKGNTFSYKKDGLKIIESMDSSTYLLSGYVPGATKAHLKAASGGIRYFIFNMAIPESDRADVGWPRGKYKNWIGHMWPDDEQAGFDLADALVKASNANRFKGDIRKQHIIGLSAHRDEYAGYYRNEGLERFARTKGNIILNDISFTQWDEGVTRNTTRELLTRYPDTDIVWTAGEVIAMWASDVMKGMGRRPGKDIFTGGINWTPDSLKAVASGEMVTMLGGHFMQGGWALILMHDYELGIDFKNELSTGISAPLYPVTGENVNRYLEAIVNQKWRDVDFRTYSKYYNRDLKKYDFSPDAVLR